MIKAYWLFITTGWKSIKYFPLQKNDLGRKIVCLKNNSVMEFNYSTFGGVYWFKDDLGDEKPQNPVLYYRNLPSPPKQKDNA